MKTAILLTALALAGCGQTVARVPEPITVVKEVKVPVPVACIPNNYDFEQPEYVDSDAALKAAADAASRYQLLWGGRAQRMARERENEIVLRGCRQ